ncbi:MAG: RusA family crossover junction endodeoxyribonuclease [Oscillospiraceae bacterium]|nr:RusA family crossover junction endodeoxyribonuclease [Oscillospiraceae bacterium]
MKNYAKIIIKGSPISKSNFKLYNLKGRAILPYNTGKYHDRYANYEDQIALEAKIQNPGIFITESMIAILKVYYKSEKRHPDTNNITKSIFDGVEKSGIIANDAQIRRLIIEEYYDKIDPRFELELFGESEFEMQYMVNKRLNCVKPIEYTYPSNKKIKYKIKTSHDKLNGVCNICNKSYHESDLIKANNGSIIICKKCFIKLVK